MNQRRRETLGEPWQRNKLHSKMSFFQSSLVLLAGLRLFVFMRTETARLLLYISGMTGHRSRFKGRYFMFSLRCALSRKKKFHYFLGDNKTLLLLSLEWPDEATMERLSSARWTIELELMLFFSSNNHATPSEAAVGLKLQPQCKKLNDSDGVFFNRTAKKGFSVQ